MSLFTDSDLRSRAARGKPIYKSVQAALEEHVLDSASRKEFDIFLSHSFDDKELILGITLTLEDMGYTIYVDWIHDRNLSRDKVTKETAQVLRQRMISSKSLFFATTSNSNSSKWMPWELGFKDGHNRKAAILPVASSSMSSYTGQEYLGIYPYIQRAPTLAAPTKDRLWVHTSPNVYVLYEDWLKGKEPYERK